MRVPMEHDGDRAQAQYAADFRKMVLSFLKDGVWYDGTVKPPPYFGQEFHQSHDHYYAWKADGMLSQRLLDMSIGDIRQHGSDEDMILLGNKDGVGLKALPALLPWDARWAVPQIVAKLSNYGVKPKYTYPYHTAVCIVDWMPNNYALLLAEIPDSIATVKRGAGLAVYLDGAAYVFPKECPE